MSGTGYSVNQSALDGIRQGLDATHAGLVKTVDQTEPDCNAGTDAYPGWSSSAVHRRLHAAHVAVLRGHASDIAGYSANVQSAAAYYFSAEQAVTNSINDPRKV
jgi:hypothetical protein